MRQKRGANLKPGALLPKLGRYGHQRLGCDLVGCHGGVESC